ncbi:MAG: DeoR/GlpR transcriptional regulator, partial [Deltaproteobacteria bacterium]
EKGLYNSNALLADTERSMLAAAEEVIVVADSGKFGHSALAHLCPLDRVHRVVVDAGLSEEWKNLLTSAGIALTIAEN